VVHASLAGGLACFGSHNGKFHAVDAQTGVQAWEFQTTASRNDPPGTLDPDGSLEGVVYALR
jgi:outer membrane protein assembly factor BamB